MIGQIEAGRRPGDPPGLERCRLGVEEHIGTDVGVVDHKPERLLRCAADARGGKRPPGAEIEEQEDGRAAGQGRHLGQLDADPLLYRCGKRGHRVLEAAQRGLIRSVRCRHARRKAVAPDVVLEGRRSQQGAEERRR